MNKDCLLIYKKYLLLSEEITDKRYLVIFGSLDTGLTEKVYVAAANDREALYLAKIKMSEDYPEFEYDHHYVVQKPWPKDYLGSVED